MGNTQVIMTVTGTVQGVSFRKHTRRMAEELQVTGWVRNRDDGSVEGCFEGLRSNIEALLAWCSVGPERARVESITREFHTFTGRFADFRIIADK